MKKSNLLTYLPTPWSRALLEKLTGSAASQEIPRIFGTPRFITILTSASHLSLSWANSIQSPQPPPTSWRSILILSHKWVPVTTAWRVLRLRMEERPPIWIVASNKLNKQSRTEDEGWSSSLGLGRGANNASPWKPMLWNIHRARCFLWNKVTSNFKSGGLHGRHVVATWKLGNHLSILTID